MMAFGFALMAALAIGIIAALLWRIADAMERLATAAEEESAWPPTPPTPPQS